MWMAALSGSICLLQIGTEGELKMKKSYPKEKFIIFLDGVYFKMTVVDRWKGHSVGIGVPSKLSSDETAIRRRFNRSFKLSKAFSTGSWYYKELISLTTSAVVFTELAIKRKLTNAAL